jgi:ATP dependent DNA ligase domain
VSRSVEDQVAGDPRRWVAMRPYRGRRKFEIHDPLIEPLWSGVRVLAHVDSADGAGTEPSVALIEDLGVDLLDELPEIGRAVGRSVMAHDAIIDGAISRQVGLDGIGAAAIPEVRGSATNLIMRNNAEIDVVPRGPAADVQSEVEGFIAFDLLRLDGTDLLDVPLLERKRLLESVIEQSPLVRISIHVRPPLESWVSTWKSLGLRGAVLKAANSRYQPGGDTIEWRLVESAGRRG